MVPADSHRVSRAPRYLGATRKEKSILGYGAVTRCGRPSQTVLITLVSLSLGEDLPGTGVPTSSSSLWSCNPALSFRIARFRLFRVRSPLLAESLLFSLPRGTEMVHFPPFARHSYVFTVS